MPNTFQSPLQKALVTWLTAHPNVTLAELSRRSGIDKGDLSKINSGQKNSLNMESASNLAKAMGTTVEGLLDGDPAPVTARDAVRLSPQAIEVGARLIPLKDIEPSPDNPRKDFDKAALGDLAASIAEQGLLQPIVVRAKGKRFEIIAGERRFRALQINGAAQAFCVIRDGDDDGNTRALRIIENLQRADIKPLEEAEAFAALNELDPEKWHATAIGRAIGKSDRFVAQRIAVARNLHPDLKAKLLKGELKVEVARVMATAPQKLQKALSNDYYALRDADDCRRKLQGKAIPLSAAAFKVDLYDGEFLEEAGKKWFADKTKFGRLQGQAADLRLEKLKKDYPEAKRVSTRELDDYVWADNGEGVHSYWGPKRSEAKSRKRGLAVGDCTALVWVEENKIHTAKNVVPRAAWDTKIEKKKPRASGSANRPQEEGKREKEARLLNVRLTEAFGKRPDLAKRLVVYAFLGAVGNDFEIHVDPRPYVGEQSEALAEFTQSDNGYFDPYQPSSASTDKLWATLRALDDPAIDGLFARMMSDAIHVGPYGNADGITRAIAAEVGVEIPANFLPKAGDEDEDEDDEDDDATNETEEPSTDEDATSDQAASA